MKTNAIVYKGMKNVQNSGHNYAVVCKQKPTSTYLNKKYKSRHKVHTGKKKTYKYTQVKKHIKVHAGKKYKKVHWRI